MAGGLIEHKWLLKRESGSVLRARQERASFLCRSARHLRELQNSLFQSKGHEDADLPRIATAYVAVTSCLMGVLGIPLPGKLAPSNGKHALPVTGKVVTIQGADELRELEEAMRAARAAMDARPTPQPVVVSEEKPSTV